MAEDQIAAQTDISTLEMENDPPWSGASTSAQRLAPFSSAFESCGYLDSLYSLLNMLTDAVLDFRCPAFGGMNCRLNEGAPHQWLQTRLGLHCF